MALDFSRLGKPTDNAFIESFNGTLREEYLNQHWFLLLEDAREKLESCRLDYNRSRPHSSFGNQTPSEFAQKKPSAQARQTEAAPTTITSPSPDRMQAEVTAKADGAHNQPMRR